MTYLNQSQTKLLGRLLQTFFSLPYSTDLDGKDAETLLRIVKGATETRSKRKELFDIVDGPNGYSVKTLFKPPASLRVDLQEQRFCEVEEVRRLKGIGGDNAAEQGKILLSYMYERISQQMVSRGLRTAKSLILLKHWDKTRTNFQFMYWEEDFLGFVTNLRERDAAGEIEWVVQDAGLHARDKKRLAAKRGSQEPVRLLRMHYKHNQIFTDHDIPQDATRISFSCKQISWDDLSALLGKVSSIQARSVLPLPTRSLRGKRQAA
jgi:hypothetical protein